MVKVHLMCSVTKQQPEWGGQCSKRDWTARLISTAAGLTTNGGLNDESVLAWTGHGRTLFR